MQRQFQHMATKSAGSRKLWMEEYGDRVEADV